MEASSGSNAAPVPGKENDGQGEEEGGSDKKWQHPSLFSERKEQTQELLPCSGNTMGRGKKPVLGLPRLSSTTWAEMWHGLTSELANLGSSTLATKSLAMCCRSASG